MLGADIVLVLFDVVQQAAEGHQLGDELHRGRQADAKQATHMGVFHSGHHISLLQWGVYRYNKTFFQMIIWSTKNTLESLNIKC